MSGEGALHRALRGGISEKVTFELETEGGTEARGDQGDERPG